MNSPSPAQTDHLRRLLDQRAARADTRHGRFPSLTEFSDSPSIYSHAHFSPHPPHLDSSPPPFDFAIPAQYALSSEPARPYHATAHAQFDAGQHGADSTMHTYRDRNSSPEPPPDDDELDPRMSFLGPTMRFHSPAPWELERTISEEGDKEDDARSIITKRSRSKTRGEGFIKGFGRSTPAKAAPSTRPSGESLRSTTSKGKNSLDVHSPLSPMHTLPQASMSTSSLAAAPTSWSSRPGHVLSRGRARTVSNTAGPDASLLLSHVSPGMSPTPTHSPAIPPTPTRSASPAQSMYSTILTPTDTPSLSRPVSPLSLRGPTDFVHPYANPDLVYDSGPPHITTAYPTSRFTGRGVTSSDSNLTISESVATQSSSTLTPDTSLSSVTDYHLDTSKKAVSGIQGKAISNPLPTNAGHQGQQIAPPPHRDPNQLALPSQIPGWAELPVSPTFNLISLQEAQAQARERSRTHVQVTPEAHFLQNEPPRHGSNISSGNAIRLRTRTASAGVRSKTQPLVISNPLPLSQPNVEDAQAAQPGSAGAPPRGLKHKKSGFMRLFNGKDKEKPSTPSPPPIPPVAAVPSLPRTPKISSARVPVPTLSPSLVPQSPLHLDGFIRNDNAEHEWTNNLQGRATLKRQGPPLSIVPPDASPGAPLDGSFSQSAHPDVGNNASLVPEVTVDRGAVPSSAPPLTTSFAELSLRPVSTVFSAHFAGHIVPTGSPSGTTTSTSTGYSPLSPAFAQRSSDERSVCEDDPYAVIQTLQDQIKSTRKAWQHQIWELEGQVRDLRAEIDEMRLREMRGERCLLCGRGGESERSASDGSSPGSAAGTRSGVVDRPRARTGVGTRFGAAT